jgi:hypothetical protein
MADGRCLEWQSVRHVHENGFSIVKLVSVAHEVEAQFIWFDKGDNHYLYYSHLEMKGDSHE